MAVIAPELVVLATLQSAFATLKANPATLADLFSNYDSKTLASIIQWVTDHTPQFVLGWPQQDESLATVAIVLGSETESTREGFQGDFQEPHLDASGTVIYDQYGQNDRVQLNIMVLTQLPDLTIWLHRIIKFIITVNKLTLHAPGGLVDLTMNSQDFQVDPEQFPNFKYNRMLTLNFLSSFVISGVPLGVINKFIVQVTFNGTVIAATNLPANAIPTPPGPPTPGGSSPPYSGR